MKLTRLALITGSLLLASFLLHLLIYRLEFSIMTLSNVLFVVGIIVFLPSVIAMTSAYRIFQSMKYVFRVIVSPSFKQMFPTFKDYQTEKTKEIKTSLFLEIFLVTLVMILASAILAWVWFQ
ncbi:MAG: DUF3899 domain-containing protein [Acholeplasmataceae bacterium]|jgi:hypothetical protein